MHYKKLLSSLIFLFIFSFSFLTFSSKVHAGVTALTGWGWSSNTGWVSFNCSNMNTCRRNGGNDYAVRLSTTTDRDTAAILSGYAWSNNVGWIKFDHNDPNHANPGVNLQTGAVYGYVRACAGTLPAWWMWWSPGGDCSSNDSRSDGWDGWINLAEGVNGLKYPTGRMDGSGGATYNISEGIFKGFDWGDVNVGWLQLSPTFVTRVNCNNHPCIPIRNTVTNPPTATCTLPSSVTLGQNQTQTTVYPTVTSYSGGTGPYTYSPSSFTLTAGKHTLYIYVTDNSVPKQTAPIFCGEIDIIPNDTPPSTIDATCTVPATATIPPGQNSTVINPTVSGFTGGTWPYTYNPTSFTLTKGLHTLYIRLTDSSVPAKQKDISCGTVNVNDTPPVLTGLLPKVTLTASPSVVSPGGATVLTWTPENATSCTAPLGGGTWALNANKDKNPANGPHSESQSNIQTPQSYYIYCTNNFGSSPLASAIVDVQSTVAGVPTVTLTASPNPVDYNGSTVLTWTPTNATSCTALGDWSGSKLATNGPHPETRYSITAQKTYYMYCSNAAGSSNLATVVVGVNPQTNGGNVPPVGGNGGCTSNCGINTDLSIKMWLQPKNGNSETLTAERYKIGTIGVGVPIKWVFGGEIVANTCRGSIYNNRPTSPELFVPDFGTHVIPKDSLDKGINTVQIYCRDRSNITHYARAGDSTTADTNDSSKADKLTIIMYSDSPEIEEI